MSNWLGKIRTEPGVVFAARQESPSSSALSPQVPSSRPRRDPNATDSRFQINSKCVYERRLPGDAYVVARVERLQAGYYDSPIVHEGSVEHVRFVAVNFIFHQSRNINRFRSAQISIALHHVLDHDGHSSDLSLGTEQTHTKPRFLRHAPHVLYGAISPETLNWNFSIAGSLGVSQTPVTASLSPSGGMHGSYKMYDMMKIQGSLRTLKHWMGHEYDIEDGEIVWTLEENSLQRSGLPREFTFVMLISKGEVNDNVLFDVEVEPRLASWYGHYPRWYANLPLYQPLHKVRMDIDKEVGQRFEPTVSGHGFNFADLTSSFDDFVSMPGTTYSTSDPLRGANDVGLQQSQTLTASGIIRLKKQQQVYQPATGTSDAHPVNLHVYLDPYSSRATLHSNPRATPAPSPSPFPSQQCKPSQKPSTGKHRRRSLRRSRSRSELKEYGAWQDRHQALESMLAGR